MKPGTPVSTTALNLTFAVMPSRISRMASSGRADISKFSRIWPGLVEVVRKRQQYDPVLPTEIEQVPFGEVRMGFDLHHRGLDPRSRNDLLQLLQGNIRQADCLAVSVIDEALERVPRLDQRHPRVVYYLAGLVPRVLLVAGSKGKRGMHEIAIDMVEPQSSDTCVEGGLDPFRTMIGVP